MKILVATGSYPPEIGGPATYSRLLAENLPKLGFTVNVSSFGRFRRMPKIVRHIAFSFQILWHGRSSDVIFAQDAVSVGLPALLAAFLLGKPLLVRLPGDYAWEQAKRFGVNDSMTDFQNKRYSSRVEMLRCIQKFVIRNSDAVIVPSRSFAEIVKLWVKDSNKVRAIYNGIDLGEIDRAVRGVSMRSKTIISAGRLVYNKGFDMLVKAMKKLPDWSLEIAGDGPEQVKLERLIETEGLSGRVRLLGRLDRNELLKKIASAEVFALNTYFETFSYQVVEAMACGTVVTVTRVGSLQEIVADNENGVLLTPNSEAEFLAAIKHVHNNTDYRNKLVDSAKVRAHDFSIGATVQAIIEIMSPFGIGEQSPELRMRVKASKIVRYLFSGGLAAFTNIFLLYVFTDIAHIWYLISSMMSFLVAFVVSFMLQKFFTFQDHGTDGMHGQALTYLIVTGTNLFINTGLIYLFVEYAHLHYLWAQIVSSIFIAIESFVIYGMFIFKKKPAIAGVA